MLKRIYIDNYKCLVNFELRLGELVLLLGPNGVGKSAVFDLLFAVRQLLSGRAAITAPDVFPTRTLTRWDRRASQIIEMEIAVDGDDLTYRLELEHEVDRKRAKIALERLTATDGTLFEFKMGEVRLYDDHGKPGAQFAGDWTESFLARVVARKENKRLTRFLDYVRKLVVCGVYPQAITTESSSEDPILARDGSNFSSWYRHIFQERPDLVPDFTLALTEVIDGFKALRLEKVSEETRAMSVMFEHGTSPYELRLDEVSDGQRALMVLYALLHLTPGQGYTLLLDEPDNYVALGEIQPWLMALSDSSGESVPQVILCSHHPEMIDYLGVERGLLLDRQNAGPVTVRPVTDVKVTGGLKLSELVARGWQS